MSWEQTGEFMSDGRPIWKCPDCGRRIWGHRVAPHTCNGKAPEPPATAATVPCRFRGDVYTSIKVSSCCKSAVFRCGQEDDALCVIKEKGLVLNGKELRCCLSCPFKQ